jgi:hypothetical protein
MSATQLPDRVTGSAPAIRVNGLRKSFKDLQVLRDVDFDVPPGTIFALLGSNGAGKTTVVRILATLLGLDGGALGVNGFDVVANPAQVRRSISLTGQFAAVDEILTGRENLVLVARLRHCEARVRSRTACSSGRRRHLARAGLVHRHPPRRLCRSRGDLPPQDLLVGLADCFSTAISRRPVRRPGGSLLRRCRDAGRVCRPGRSARTRSPGGPA